MDATNRRRPSSSHPVGDVDESLASEIADLGLDPAAGAKPRRFDARIARLKQREEDLQRLLASVRFVRHILRAVFTATDVVQYIKFVAPLHFHLTLFLLFLPQSIRGRASAFTGRKPRCSNSGRSRAIWQGQVTAQAHTQPLIGILVT
jgi:hypothetical protein